MSLLGTLNTGVSALRSFSKGLEVVGNNIANVNTSGFKSSRATFSDSFSNTVRSAVPSASSVVALSSTQVGTGVKLNAVAGKFTQGALNATGVITDLGISGSGFFRVVNPTDDAQYVTRAGGFRLDYEGNLVTGQGYRVQGLTGGSAGTPPTTVGDIKLGTPPAGTALQ